MYNSFATELGLHPLSVRAFPGEEAINFQLNSKIGKRLTDIFQEVIDYRNNLDVSKYSGDANAQSDYRVSQVYSYVKTTMAKKFTQAVEQEIGFKVTKLHVIGGRDMGVNGFFAVDLSFDSWEDATDIMNTATGASSSNISDEETVNEMRQMASRLDLTTGTLTGNYYGTKRRPIAVQIYFDANCAFLLHEFLPGTVVQDHAELTARELAAIMMHEIGHVMTFVEHSSDIFVMRRRLDNFQAHLRQTTDFKQLVTVATEGLRPFLEKMQQFQCSNKVASKMIPNISKQLLTALNATAQAVNANDDPSFNLSALGTIIGKMIRTVFMLVIHLILANVFLCLLFLTMDELIRSSVYSEQLYGKKNSDFNVNYNNSFLMERWADEFVSRQGYGDELASGLNKLIYAANHAGYFGETNNAWLRNSTAYGVLAQMCAWLLQYTSIAVCFSSYGYEEQYERICRMTQNQYAFFKDPHLPGAIADSWLDKLQKLKEEEQRVRTRFDSDVIKWIHRVLKDFLLVNNWYRWIKNGQLDREYEKLQNRLDDLSNNPLYAAAYQLKRR